MVPMSDSNNQLTLYKNYIHVIHKYNRENYVEHLVQTASIKGFGMVREMLSQGSRTSKSSPYMD